MFLKRKHTIVLKMETWRQEPQLTYNVPTPLPVLPWLFINSKVGKKPNNGVEITTSKCWWMLCMNTNTFIYKPGFFLFSSSEIINCSLNAKDL